MYKQFQAQFGRFLIIVCITIALYFLIKYTILYMYPFIIAFILAFLMNPLVTLFEIRLNISRLIAMLLSFLFVITLFVSSLYIFLTTFVQSTLYLAEKTPTYFKLFVTFLEDWIQTKLLPYYYKINNIFTTLDADKQTTINNYLEQFFAYIATSGAKILQLIFLKLSLIVTILPSSITAFIITLLATCLIMYDWQNIQHKIKQFIPTYPQVLFGDIFYHLKKTFGNYLKAQCILISIAGSIVFISLLILRIEHAFTISLLSMVADLLPFIGTGFIFIPWISFLFITGQYSLTIYLIIIYMILIVTRQLIEPKILATNIGLHPLAVLFTLFIGIQLWGAIGLITAPVLLIFLKALQQAGIFAKVWLFIIGE